jgi:8-oxo-dGTP diphosphatase
VLWRPGPLVCVVHRPRYDDWSLPKGKLKRGEHPLAAAVREVREETGMCGFPQRRLPTVRYTLPSGQPKTVRFWSLRAAGDDGGPPPEGDEVDEVCWLPPAEAAALLSYPDDARVVAAFRPATHALPLVRHGRAGKRDTHWGPDDARPLDDRGRAQAQALAPLLALFAPQRLLAATPVRCRQTLEPAGALLDVPVEADSAFDEPRPGETRQERAAVLAQRLTDLAAAREPVAVCSQGKVMPPALARLTGGEVDAYRTPKGSGWLLAFDGDRLVGADRLDPQD